MVDSSWQNIGLKVPFVLNAFWGQGWFRGRKSTSRYADGGGGGGVQRTASNAAKFEISASDYLPIIELINPGTSPPLLGEYSFTLVKR